MSSVAFSFVAHLIDGSLTAEPKLLFGDCTDAKDTADQIELPANTQTDKNKIINQSNFLY